MPSYPSCMLCDVMYTAHLVCTDPACSEEHAAETATLAELDALVCECGCALELVGWPDVAAEPLAEVILLRAVTRLRRQEQRAA